MLAVAAAAAGVAALTRVGPWRESNPAARPPAAALGDLTTPLPSDPDVLTGRLDNGLRYYIRRNTQPLGRAELRLVVNAGSVLETDDQRGYAHFVEHMAFNGTEHFPKQAIAEFLQSVGMRFGPSINAATGFDETVYSLQIPTDRPDVLARSLQIFEDWAHRVTFDAAEVERERAVIVEEWRQRRGAGQRLQEAQAAVLFGDSPYATRSPIGTTESLERVTSDRLKAFYREWYRPDLIAVVAVGDFDAAAVDRLVRAQFAGLSSPAHARPRPVVDPDQPTRAQYSVSVDEEAAGASVAIHTRRPPLQHRNVGDYRQEIIERLAVAIVSARLAESAQRPGAPILGANAGRARVVRAEDVLSVRAALRPEGIDKGVLAFFLETERIARFGATVEELERQKTNTLRGLERAIAEKDARPSASLAAEYIRNFTVDEPFPGLEYEFDLHKRFLAGVSLDEVNTFVRAWLGEPNRLVVLQARQDASTSIPTAEWLERSYGVAKVARMTPYVARPDSQPLLTELPTPGAVARTTSRGAGITEWELSNGARVVLMPTTFKEDEILFTAISPGGTSLAPDDSIVPAQTAAQVVTSLGVGKFASADLRRALTGKVAAVRPTIGSHEEGMSGGASPTDLESLFQLVYLYFTQPRPDPNIFKAYTSQMKSALAAQTDTPEFAFAAALSSALTQDHPRARPMTAETIAAMDMERSLAFYRDRFADASDFTFIFVGSFQPEALRPFVEQYLASLPALHRKERARDQGVHPPGGIVERRVERGTDPKSRTAIVFSGPWADPAQGLALRAAAEVLQTRLMRVLREDLGGTYTVSVQANVSRIPRDEYNVTVNFGSDPARADALAKRVLEEAAALAATGPSATDAANVKTAMTRELETSSRQNASLLMQLAQRYRTGDAPESLLDAPKLVQALDAAAIRDAARAAFNPARYVRVTLVPGAK